MAVSYVLVKWRKHSYWSKEEEKYKPTGLISQPGSAGQSWMDGSAPFRAGGREVQQQLRGAAWAHGGEERNCNRRKGSLCLWSLHNTRCTGKQRLLHLFPTDCAYCTRPGFLSARLLWQGSGWLLQCKRRRPGGGFLGYLKQYYPITLHNCTGVRTFWLLFHLLAIILKT